VPTIDRADLITEADLDEEPEDDNLDTGVSLEDIDAYIDYVDISREDYDV